MKPMPHRKITLIDGQYAARVQVDDVSQAHAEISRDVAFSCDTVDGSWTVLARTQRYGRSPDGAGQGAGLPAQGRGHGGRERATIAPNERTIKTGDFP